MERDILLERLEKKLAEKEREVEELRKLLSSNTIEELKEKIIKEIEERYDLKNLEAKIAELSKAINSIMDEILYIKSEIRSGKKKREIVEVDEMTENRDEESLKEEEDIIIVD